MELIVHGERVFAANGGVPHDPDHEVVVFIHGVAQDHTIWVLPTRYFSRHGRNVVAVDLPGHGRSGGAPLETIEDMADWVIETLDAIGVGRAALVGHSMGSLVALDTAGRYPERVRAVAMVGVSFPLAVARPLLASASEDSHDAIDMLTYWGHSNAAQLGGSKTPGMWMAGKTMRLMERAAPGLIHTDLSACDRYSAGAERSERVECPTLLLLGEKDRMTPARDAEAIRAKLPNSETVVLAGAGHLLLMERSDPVLDELIKIV